MVRTSFKSFKQKALEQRGVKEAYENLPTIRRLRRQLVALRQGVGMTQEQVADKLDTKKSNISRLENINSSISPKLSTIVDYANAVGYDVRIDFIPKKKPRRNKSL